MAHLVLVAIGVASFAISITFFAPTFFAENLVHTAAGADAEANGRLETVFRSSVMAALFVAAVVSSLAAVIASLFISERLAGPVRRLAVAARRISTGNYSERVRIDAADPVHELEQLAGSFNDMGAALATMERRRAELLSDVAHELRTPIFTLEGYLEGLLDGVVEPSPETWARLHAEAGRLRRLVDDLRDLSRLESSGFSLDLEPVDPLSIAQASLDPLRLDFSDKGLEVIFDPPVSLPLVRADYDRAVQILKNLLTNALRYTPTPGQVELSLAVQPGRREVLFSVADSGVGIASEHLPHLFERFYRVDKSRSRSSGGSGLGLTIAKALVEAMGGRIWATSPGPDLGSTFSFALPVARSHLKMG